MFILFKKQKIENKNWYIIFILSHEDLECSYVYQALTNILFFFWLIFFVLWGKRMPQKKIIFCSVCLKIAVKSA
jgi:hypothetical protein